MKGKSERIWKAPFACGIGFGSSRVRVQLILRFRLPIYEREYSKDGFSTFVLFPTSYMRKLYMEKNDDDDDRAMKLCPILFGESLWHERCCAFFFPDEPSPPCTTTTTFLCDDTFWLAEFDGNAIRYFMFDSNRVVLFFFFHFYSPATISGGRV